MFEDDLEYYHKQLSRRREGNAEEIDKAIDLSVLLLEECRESLKKDCRINRSKIQRTRLTVSEFLKKLEERSTW